MVLSLIRNKKAQSAAEYAILIGLVIGAVIAMQTYVKRSLQAGVKYSVDRMAEAGSPTTVVTQYEPYYLETNYDVQSGRQAGSMDSDASPLVGGNLVNVESVGVTGEITRSIQNATGGAAKSLTTREGYQKMRGSPPVADDGV